jgi:hypothetical protein
MKKMLLALVALSVLSCKKDVAEKPEHLISENEMTDILYDIALLQAMKSYNTVTLSEKGIDSRTYIYKKYKIDSLTLAKNHEYYATDLEKYDEMTKKVIDRINALKKGNRTKTPGSTTTPPESSGQFSKQAEKQENGAEQNRQLPLNEIDRK